MRTRTSWVVAVVVLAVVVATYFTFFRSVETPIAGLVPEATRAPVATASQPPHTEVRTPIEPQALVPSVAAADPTPVAPVVDPDKPPPGNLNDWPGSKPLRRWLLKKALKEMRESTGTAQCFHRAHDVVVYSLSSIMNAQGRWEPRAPPFAPRNDSELYFNLNDRAYRPFVGEFPEFDQFMAALNARDGFEPRGGATPQSAGINEITPEHMRALEARAEAAFRILED